MSFPGSCGQLWFVKGIRSSVLAMCAVACGSSPQTYEVMLRLKGSGPAFRGRTIDVQGIRAKDPVQSNGSWWAEVMLCTTSESRFLNEPVRFTVQSNGEVVATTVVERTKCRDAWGSYDKSAINGRTPIEWNILHLEDDGTVVRPNPPDPTDLLCAPPAGPPASCEHPNL